MSARGTTLFGVFATAALALSSCGKESARYDAVIAHHEGAAMLGAGSENGDQEAVLACDPTGKTDWPPVTVYVVLPEAGDEISDLRETVVDGRRIADELSLKIDGHTFKISDRWAQKHEGIQRAIIAGAVDGGERLAKTLRRAKTIEFAGDKRRFRLNVSQAEDALRALADVCAAAGGAQASPEDAGGRASTRLSAEEISAAVANRWRSGDAVFEKNGLRYRITTGVETPDEMPPDAQSRKITAYPGIGLEGDSGPFRTVAVAYAVFDRPEAAQTYFSDADFNLGEQEVAETKTFKIRRPGYPEVPMNCVYVPSSDHSVNCHFLTPDKRIVAMLLLIGGPSIDLSGHERAIDRVFADEAALDRASLAASASWAYLYDALYR